MQFSDTTNHTGVIQDYEDRLNLTRGYISGDNDRLRKATRQVNNRLHRAGTIIRESSPDVDLDDPAHGDRPAGTFPLSAARAFEMDSSDLLLKFKRVDVTYDGSTFYKATLFDSSSVEDGMGNETTEDSRFSTSSPFYDIEGNSLLIFPKPTAAQVSAGAAVRIEWSRALKDFVYTDTTAVVGLDAPFDQYPSMGAAYDELIASRSKDTSRLRALKQEILELENLMRQHYSNKALEVPQTMQPLVTLDDYS